MLHQSRDHIMSAKPYHVIFFDRQIGNEQSLGAGMWTAGVCSGNFFGLGERAGTQEKASMPTIEKEGQELKNTNIAVQKIIAFPTANQMQHCGTK